MGSESIEVLTGIGKWGMGNRGNGVADFPLLMKSGCGGRGRIALSIPHSRLPIPGFNRL